MIHLDLMKFLTHIWYKVFKEVWQRRLNLAGQITIYWNTELMRKLPKYQFYEEYKTLK